MLNQLQEVMDKTQITIGVLMGGHSEERDVSQSTGKAILQACNTLGYKTVVLDMIGDSLKPLQSNIKTCDIIFIGLHGGSGENGQVQKELENMDIPYTGSGPESSSICMDKDVSKRIVKSLQIDTAEWINIEENDISKIQMDCPLVVKPNDQGSTVGLTIVHEKSELQSAIDFAFNFGNNIMIESYIDGREITVGIVDDQVMPIVEIVPSHELYDYECKYTDGMSSYTCPAEISDELTEKIQDDSLRIFRALKCEGYGRIDYLLTNDNKYYFLEMNTLPGLTSTSLLPKAVAANGESFETLIQKIIEKAI